MLRLPGPYYCLRPKRKGEIIKDFLSKASEAGRSGAPRSGSLAPVAAFGLASGLGAGALILVSELLFGAQESMPSIGAALLAYLAATAFSASAIHQSYPHAKLGLCNLATLARLVIVGVLLVAVLERAMPNAALLALAILSLCLDGVDGWLARRQGLSSDFGARFDVEVDAAFALLLAIYAALTEVTGAYVILLGLPHYLFWAAKHLWPWLDRPLPTRFSRKAVCVMQISALIALLVPRFDGMVMDAVILTVVAALAWSFGRDILWLYRGRA